MLKDLDGTVRLQIRRVDPRNREEWMGEVKDERLHKTGDG